MKRAVVQHLVLLLALSSGCAAHRQYFRPSESQHGRTVQGYPEAMYALVGAQGQFGEAKLWSKGSYRGRSGETLIQLGVELHNTSGQPLTLSAADLRLDSIDTELGTLGGIAARNARDRVVAPGALAEAGFEFELPARVAPGEIAAFVVRWRVQQTAQTYSQRTPFVVEYRSHEYYPSPYARYGYYGAPFYTCDAFDPFCPYPYGLYAPPIGPPYYPGVVVVPAPPARTGIVVHPRR